MFPGFVPLFNFIQHSHVSFLFLHDNFSLWDNWNEACKNKFIQYFVEILLFFLSLSVFVVLDETVQVDVLSRIEISYVHWKWKVWSKNSVIWALVMVQTHLHCWSAVTQTVSTVTTTTTITMAPERAVIRRVTATVTVTATAICHHYP